MIIGMHSSKKLVYTNEISRNLSKNTIVSLSKVACSWQPGLNFRQVSLKILCISCPLANRRRVCIHLQLHLFLFAYTHDVPHKHPYAIVCRYSTLCAVNMLYPTCFPITWTTTAVGISKIWSSLAITPSWRMKNTIEYSL